jgi:tetratricopeptide (TPR) repeat protein
MGRSSALRRETVAPIETLGPEVGKRIRAARQARGLSLAQVGGEDLSRSFLSLVELGRSRISLKALSIVASRLDLPMSYFLEGDVAPRAAAAELLLDQAESTIQRGDPGAAIAMLTDADVPDSLEARLGLVRAQALLAADRSRDAVHTAEAALLIAQRLNDMQREAALRYIIGAALYRQGAWDEAVPCLRRVVEDLADIEDHDPSLLAKATVCLGHIHYARGEIDLAIDYYTRARDLFGVVTNLDSMASVYSGLSLAHWRKQDYTTALHYSKLSLAMYERRQNLLGAATELNNIATRQVELGDLVAARDAAKVGLERARQVGSPEVEAIAHSTLAEVSLKQDLFEEAEHEASEAVALAVREGSPARIGGWTVLATLAERRGDHERVDELYGKALAELQRSEQHLHHADVAVAYSLALRRRGETDRAFDLALQAAQMKSIRSA